MRIKIKNFCVVNVYETKIICKTFQGLESVL